MNRAGFLEVPSRVLPAPGMGHPGVGQTLVPAIQGKAETEFVDQQTCQQAEIGLRVVEDRSRRRGIDQLAAILAHADRADVLEHHVAARALSDPPSYILAHPDAPSFRDRRQAFGRRDNLKAEQSALSKATCTTNRIRLAQMPAAASRRGTRFSSLETHSHGHFSFTSLPVMSVNHAGVRQAMDG